jgi:hypothetical protein
MLLVTKVNNSYLCTYDLYGPVCNAFVEGSIHYEGKWEGVGPWKSRLYWPCKIASFWAQKVDRAVGKQLQCGLLT